MHPPVHRYRALIAPQLAIRVLEVARVVVPLGPVEIVALELVVIDATPMTEHRYISFVGASVISPLATAAAISSSEKSWRGV